MAWSVLCISAIIIMMSCQLLIRILYCSRSVSTSVKVSTPVMRITSHDNNSHGRLPLSALSFK